MNSLYLKSNPTLTDFQEYLLLAEKERGFFNQKIEDKCLILGEEVGELFKAIRKELKIKIDEKSKIGTIDEELADVITLVFSIANKLNINMEIAIRKKEELNNKRTWK